MPQRPWHLKIRINRHASEDLARNHPWTNLGASADFKVADPEASGVVPTNQLASGLPRLARRPACSVSLLTDRRRERSLVAFDGLSK